MAGPKTDIEIAPAWSGEPAAPPVAHPTETGRLNMHRLALIGILGSEGERRALMRRADGRILSLHVGDATPEGRVAAIGASTVSLLRGRRIRALTMPD